MSRARCVRYAGSSRLSQRPPGGRANSGSATYRPRSAKASRDASVYACRKSGEGRPSLSGGDSGRAARAVSARIWPTAIVPDDGGPHAAQPRGAPVEAQRLAARRLVRFEVGQPRAARDSSGGREPLARCARRSARGAAHRRHRARCGATPRRSRDCAAPCRGPMPGRRRCRTVREPSGRRAAAGRSRAAPTAWRLTRKPLSASVIAGSNKRRP